MYLVQYSREALKVLRRLPSNTRATILGKVEALAVDPLAPNNNVKALTGRAGFRLRVGDWRVIYDLDHGLQVLAVERVGPRGSVYE